MTLTIDPFTLQLLVGACLAYLARRRHSTAKKQRAAKSKRPPKRRLPD